MFCPFTKITFKYPSRIALCVAKLSTTVRGTARFVKASPMQSSNSSVSLRRSYKQNQIENEKKNKQKTQQIVKQKLLQLKDKLAIAV